MTTYDITTTETIRETRRYLIRAATESDAVRRILSGEEPDFDLDYAFVESREIGVAVPLAERGPYPPDDANDGPCVTHFIISRVKLGASGRYEPTERFLILGSVFQSKGGHPDEMLPRLRQFLTSAQAPSTHTGAVQPTILAAEWVAFLVNHFRAKPGPGNPEVGVVAREDGLADYRWFLDCTPWPDQHPDTTTRPRVGLQYVEVDFKRQKMEPTPWRFDQIAWIDLDGDT